MPFRRGNIPWNKGRRASGCDDFRLDHIIGMESDARDGQTEHSVHQPSDMQTASYGTRPSHAFDRPSMKVYEAARNEEDFLTVPSLLRPKCNPEDKTVSATENVNGENIIVNLLKLSELMLLSMEHNNKLCKRFLPKVVLHRRQGLCVTLRVTCDKCKFQSSYLDMFQKVEKKCGRGPQAGNINNMLLISALKTKVGASDISFILSCLNVRSPSMTYMKEGINRLSAEVTKLNNSSMLENQRIVAEVNRLRGRGNSVRVETDTSYNNRPQSGFEAASQSFCPLIENETRHKLVINIETANKLCPKRQCSHSDCFKTYKMEDSLASTESKFARRHLEKISSQNILTISSVTSDASAQLSKTIRDYSEATGKNITHFNCVIHHLRNFQKHLKNIKLSSGVPGNNRKDYMQKLSSSFRSRTRLELLRLQKQRLNEESFIAKAKSSIDNIVNCFQNNHVHCRYKSLACRAHLDGFKPRYLPYGKHINLNAADINQMKTIINTSFCPESLKKIRHLYTTNRSETMHHRLFTYAPKGNIWSRNFDGLCHSAAHSATHGTGSSSLLLARSLGLKYSVHDPFLKEMRKRDMQSSYDNRYKKSRQYKLKRLLSRKQKSHRKELHHSLYNSDNRVRSMEHSYGINPNK